MTRTVPANVTAAIANETTKPVYLIRMGWDVEVRAATWAASISWNAETWVASGINIRTLDMSGGLMEMPVGDSDPWMALALGEIPRERAIQIYEYHTNLAVSPMVSDAVLVFAGVMDEMTLTDKLSIRLIEGATNKAFPFTNIDRPTYTYLLAAGTRLAWGTDVITVNG